MRMNEQFDLKCIGVSSLQKVVVPLDVDGRAPVVLLGQLCLKIMFQWNYLKKSFEQGAFM